MGGPREYDLVLGGNPNEIKNFQLREISSQRNILGCVTMLSVIAEVRTARDVIIWAVSF